VRAPDLLKMIPHNRCWQYWTVNAKLRSNIVVLNGKDEFLFLSQLPEGHDEPDDAAIRRRLNDSLGKEMAVQFLGHWGWTPGQALVAEQFGSRRVFLCGDAAHLFTPTGGFGLNTGVDDAVNLAWKLAASVQGWGGPRLLAIYQTERQPIAVRNTGMAKALTRNVGNVPIDPVMEDDTPEGAAARRESGRVLSNFTEEFASIGIQLGARYDNSPLIVSDGAAPPPDDPSRYRPTSVPGGRAPHLWLADRSSLFDHFGVGFTLLRFNGAAARTEGLQQAARIRGIPLKLLDVDLPEGRDLYERDLALVRPDQYVAWRGDKLPEDPDRLLAQVTGS